MNINLKYIIAVYIIFVFSVSFAQNQENNLLTLDDVIKLTIKNYPLIKQNEQQLLAAQFRVEQQKSEYLPNINAQASYTRIGPIPAFSFGGENLDLAPADNYNIAVFLHQTLYDFGKRNSQVEYATSFLKSVKDNEELIKTDLSNQAVNIFFGILFLEKSIAVKDSQYSTLQEHLKIAELKIKNGAATDYDALSTKTRMIAIQNENIDLQNEKHNQELALKELIGLNRQKGISITGYFDLPRFDLNNDSLLNVAYNERPEMKIAIDVQNTAKLQKEMVDQIDNPILSADLSYGFKNGYEPNINVIRGNWVASFSVGVPIFNGSLTKKKVNEVKANIDAIDQNIDQVKQNISTNIYQATENLKTSVSKINLTKDQIDYAKQSLERANLQYQLGAGTNLEVLDAETALTQARLLNIQALYKSIINYYSLRRAAGDKIFND